MIIIATLYQDLHLTKSHENLQRYRTPFYKGENFLEPD